ncbi:hypothetical protein [Duganella sp. BJB476]|uniref:hypothetical protein n=1 Tax=Duganella sp. BJB476 TaxID=1871176 RepID=UPI000E342C9E|nr:hypothetical protein [Duganella sp. BJB476]RFP36156.1 hypothetical protein D0T21_06900 [Duganella sp. BJB476]
MSIFKFWKALFWFAIAPMYFGGDSESDSSTSTTNHVTNNATSVDKRNVASEQAVALSGDNNVVDRSQTSNTSFVDSSNRSTTSLTSFLDSSTKDSSTHFSDSSTKDSSTHFSDSSVRNTDNSTQFTDNSNRSVSYSSTDFGSVAAALGGMTTLGNSAFAFGGSAVNGSVDALKQISADNQKSVAAAFNMASLSGANSMKSSADVLGFASSAITKTADAFAAAKDGGESKNIMYALVAIAVVGVAFAFKT